VSASPPPIGVLVVGGGIAGSASALAAARRGVRVHVLDGAPGASSLATGAIDVDHWRAGVTGTTATTGTNTANLPGGAIEVLDALGMHVVPEGGSLLFTTAGVLRPARGHDAAILDVSPFPGRCIGVVRCARPGWDAVALASAAGAGWIPIDARVLRHTDERSLPDADFAARHDDEARLGWLADRLREALAASGSQPSALVLPSSLGVERSRAGALSRRVGIACGEAIALPGGPAGLRFEHARERAFAQAGIERSRGRAARAERTAEAWRVTTTDGLVLDAVALVLATGGLLGGGLEYTGYGTPLETALAPRARPPVRATLEAPLSLGAYGTPL
jgi:glycerol-3-phosphate dehydrogenase subunit B